MQSENSFLKSESVHEKPPHAESMQIFAELGETPIWETFIDAIATALEKYGATHFSLTVINSPFGERISTLPNETGTVWHLMEIAKEHFQLGCTPLLLSDIENHIASYPFLSSRIANYTNNLERLAKNGFSEGYFLADSVDNGRKHLFAVYSRYASRNDFRLLIEESRDNLVFLLKSILAFGEVKFPAHFTGAVEAGSALLKPKPRKLLKLVAEEGLMLKEAAPLLGVQLDTVNRYCADLKKTLGCKSMPQVIYRVYSQGMIAPADIEPVAPPKLPASATRRPPAADESCPEFDQAAEGVFSEGSSESHFFSQLAGCATLEEFRDSIFSIVRQLGFTDWSFSVLEAPAASNLGSLPEAVEAFYAQEDFARVDFLREHAAGNDAPLFISALERFTAQSRLTSERIRWNSAWFERLASFGYHDGYCIPHHMGRESGSKAIFSLFTRDAGREAFRQRVERCQPMLSMLVGAIVYFGFSHFSEHFLNVRTRKIKPRELLTITIVIKEGLTMKEAERRLFMSEFTASEHVNNAKKVLGARTLMHAAYLALVQGLLKEAGQR